MLLPLLGFSLASLALLKLGSLLVWVAVLALALKLSLIAIVGGCVFNIADGLKTEASRHYTLRYVPVTEIVQEVWMQLGLAAVSEVALAERALIKVLSPDWNRS